MPGATIMPSASIVLARVVVVETRERGDRAVDHTDVDAPTREPGAVDDVAAADDEVVRSRVVPPRTRPRPGARRGTTSPSGPAVNPYGCVGLDHGEVEALHRFAVELAAALEHHEHLGVVVAVHRRLESGRQLHDLRVEAAVTLREEAARRALTARLGRRAPGSVPGAIGTCHSASSKR